MVNYYFQCSTVKFRVSFMVVNLTFTDTDWHPRYGIVNRYNAFSFPRRRARDFPYYQLANRKRCLRMWRDFENERLTILFVSLYWNWKCSVHYGNRRTIVKCFRFDWKTFLKWQLIVCILCILFQMSIWINYEFSKPLRVFIKYIIYINIFFYESLTYWRFYPHFLLISNFCDFYL